MAKRENSLLWSAVAFMFGSVALVFGLDVHSRYKFGSSYDNALHVHFPSGLIIIVGAAIAVFGLIGMAQAIISKDK
jgi:hypothetical protein